MRDNPTGWVAAHIRRYVESGGARGHTFNGHPALLLTTRGRRTGALRRTALYYGRDGERFVLVATPVRRCGDPGRGTFAPRPRARCGTKRRASRGSGSSARGGIAVLLAIRAVLRIGRARTLGGYSHNLIDHLRISIERLRSDGIYAEADHTTAYFGY